MLDRTDKLRATLSDLEAQRRQLDSLDEPTRALLADVADEISAILRGSKRPADDSAAGNSLPDRLAEFEAAHPQFAGIITRLLDGLAQLGI
jgi:hypothetical protein